MKQGDVGRSLGVGGGPTTKESGGRKTARSQENLEKRQTILKMGRLH